MNRLYTYYLCLLSIILSLNTFAQEKVNSSGKEFQEYDTKLKSPHLRKTEILSFGSLFTIDDKIWGTGLEGNISKGKNSGVLLEYLAGSNKYNFENKSVLNFKYIGLRSEYYFDKYYKFFLVAGYDNYGFSFLPELQYGIAFNIPDNRKELQFRLSIISLSTYRINLSTGLQMNVDTKLIPSSDFDETFYTFMLKYNFYRF